MTRSLATISRAFSPYNVLACAHFLYLPTQRHLQLQAFSDTARSYLFVFIGELAPLDNAVLLAYT